MPELPEAYTITHNLKQILPESKLIETEIFEEYKNIPKISDFYDLYNQKVLSVNRVAKYIIIKLETKYLVIHLGMTGRIRFSLKKEFFKWDKIRFEFKNTANETFFLNFTDTRKFGRVKIVEKPIINSGIEPFNLTTKQVENLIKTIQKRNSEIKTILLDQGIISGLGNIYSNDTLFEARVNPLYKGKELTKEQIQKIIVNAEKILNEGIKLRGSSMKDKMYTDIYGNFGQYQDYFKIYDRKNCLVCQSIIIKLHIKGRSSFYCPNCQPYNI
jgi:formamidopyrimidine-DNA glycosylase